MTHLSVLPYSARHRRLIVVGVLTGNFLAALEATVVTTAMPTVIATLGGLDRFSWVFSAYMLASTVTMPIWGRLSDQYGRRPVIQTAILLFLAGSVSSGMAGSMTQLIVFRTLQGLGAGGIMPLGMTIVGEIYTPSQRARMQAVFSSVWGFSSVVGPFIGGLITARLSWRWVFFLNLPFGIAALTLLGLFLTAAEPGERPQIDFAGAATLAVAVAVLLGAVLRIGQTGALGEPMTLAALLGSIALLGLFVWIERRAAEPILPFELLRGVALRRAIVCSFLAGMAMFGSISYLPVFAQAVLGMGPTGAGSMLTPLLLAWVVSSIITGRLLMRYRLRNVVACGFALVMIGFLLLSTFGAGSAHAAILATLALMGAGMGLAMLTLLLIVQSSVDRRRLGSATSLSMFLRSLGGSVGVAVLGAVLLAGISANASTSGIGPEALQAMLVPAAGKASARQVEDLRQAFESSMRYVFLSGGVLALLALLNALRLPAQPLDAIGIAASDPSSIEPASLG